MSQYGDLEQALPGLLYGLDHQVDTGLAVAAIEFGAPVYASKGEAAGAGPKVNDKATVGFSADFSASNVVAGTVTISGGTTVNYSVTYATSHAATFAALVAALAAIPGVEVVSSNATTRSIVLSANGLLLAVTGAVTGGSAVTVTVTAASDQVLRGVAIRTMVEAASQDGTFAAPGNGTAKYNAKDAVNILTEGKCWVPVADAVEAHATAYLTSAGAWTDESSGNTQTPYTFRSSTTGAGLAVLQVVD